MYVIVRLVSLKLSRTNSQKGNSVTVVGVHVGMDLKYKARKLGFLRRYFPKICLPALWNRSNLDKRIQHFIDPEIIHGRTKKYWSDFSFQVIVHIKIRIHSFDQIHIFAKLLRIARTNQGIQLGII